MRINALKQLAALMTVPLVLVALGVGIVAVMSSPNANPASAQPASQSVSPPVSIDINTGPTPVDVTVVNNDTGDPIANAMVAKLVGIGTVRRGWDLVTTPIAVGVTDVHGVIRLICDPAQRTAFVVTAPGKAERGFGFWGCVPATQRVGLSRPAGTLSGLAVDAAGKPIANRPVRVMVNDYELLDAFSSTDYPTFEYPIDGVRNREKIT